MDQQISLGTSGHLLPILEAATHTMRGYHLHPCSGRELVEMRAEYDEQYYAESFCKEKAAWWQEHCTKLDHTIPKRQMGLPEAWPESIITRQGIQKCFTPQNVHQVEDTKADSDVEPVQGGELDNGVDKRCTYRECPFPAHQDFNGEQEGGRRELFICYACHKLGNSSGRLICNMGRESTGTGGYSGLKGEMVMHGVRGSEEVSALSDNRRICVSTS